MAEDAAARDARERLVRRLAEEFRLESVALRACERAEIPDRVDQVAYCLVVLVRKQDPELKSRRFYDLDPDDPEFGRKLARWAERVARNMKRWAPAYDRIQREAERYEIATLRSLIRTDRGEDLIDQYADTLARVLLNGPRLEEMSLDLAREADPAPADYAFARPLRVWVATFVRRQPFNYPRPPGDSVFDVPDADDDDNGDMTLEEVRDSAVERVVARIAALKETRGLLAEVIDRADRWEVVLSERHPLDPQSGSEFARVRAELLHVAGDLVREQRAMPGMLTYVVLALPSDSRLQRVTVLSLRQERIDRAAIDAMAGRMRATLYDPDEPKPALVLKTREATGRGVARARATTLERLRSEPERREARVAPVATALDGMPRTIADTDAIAAREGVTWNNVTSTRFNAAAEMTLVDKWLGRVFRRYAEGNHEH